MQEREPVYKERNSAIAVSLAQAELSRKRKMCTFISHSIASVNARAAKAPAVGLSCSSGGENSRGKRRRLESPPEQAKPAEDPEAASPGQRRSQGPPHGERTSFV